jgi:RNA polymerase sigma-70 factor, ECF subfamily
MQAQALDYGRLSDAALAARIAARDPNAVRLLTERNNQRLFRAAWSILQDRSEAEDAVQAAYLLAFAAIGTFEARSSLSTWLTRITINEALGRVRLDADSVADFQDYRDKLMQGSMQGCAPDAEYARAQVRALLEKAIEQLPQEFRTVFILREIEGLSVDDCAVALEIPPATVKTRLFRARRRLQQALAPELQSALTGSFPFAGADCAALTARVLAAWCG